MVAVFSLCFNLVFTQVSLAANENWIALANGENKPFETNILQPEPAVDSYQMVRSRQERLNAPDAVNPVQGAYLPLEGEPSIASEHWITVTAYSSEPRQTDDTPFTTAWQTPVRDGVVALNFLPKGTLVILKIKHLIFLSFSLAINLWGSVKASKCISIRTKRCKK